MTKEEFSEEVLKRLNAITNKRPRTVIEHILKHGFITTEELTNLYGYEHPPRAARDVREAGIPLETYRVKNSEGRSIGAYRFADLSKIRNDRFGGRKIFSKKFKEKLIDHFGAKCSICLTEYEDRYLQVDHRIPYEISGDFDVNDRQLDEYMLLCGSCNRAKSWSCEHCLNWIEDKSSIFCKSCYWAYPDSYNHIALRILRRIDIVFTDNEVAIYEKLKKRSLEANTTIPNYVKAIIEIAVNKQKEAE